MSDKTITIVWVAPERRCEGCGCGLILHDCLMCYADRKNRSEDGNGEYKKRDV